MQHFAGRVDHRSQKEWWISEPPCCQVSPFELAFFEPGTTKPGKGGEGRRPGGGERARHGGVREFSESTRRKAVKVEKAVARRECLVQAGASNTAFTGIVAFGLAGCEKSQNRALLVFDCHRWTTTPSSRPAGLEEDRAALLALDRSLFASRLTPKSFYLRYPLWTSLDLRQVVFLDIPAIRGRSPPLLCQSIARRMLHTSLCSIAYARSQ